MSYKKPEDVDSPRDRWKLVRVLRKGKEGHSAVAMGKWDKKPALAMRWNGTRNKPVGLPQSRGLPTWFIVPDDLHTPILLEMLRQAVEQGDEDLQKRILDALKYLGAGYLRTAG